MILIFTALISFGLKGLRNQWYILFEIVIFWFRSVLPAFFLKKYFKIKSK